MRCGKCGNPIPDWASGSCPTCNRIERDRQRYGSRRPAGNQPRKGVSKRTKSPPPGIELARDHIAVSREEQRKGINRFLRDIYGRTRLLSDILCDGGYSAGEVGQLRGERRNIFLIAVAQRWCAWLRAVLREEQAYVLIRRYALQGRPVPSLRELKDDLILSSVSVSQLQQSGLDELRQRPHRLELERLVCEAAQKALPADERR
jgi:hypothetical protein